MPFDAFVPSLQDAALAFNITPIPHEVLKQHKKAEVTKHRGSWIGRNPTTVDFLLKRSFALSELCALCCTVAIVITNHAPAPISRTACPIMCSPTIPVMIVGSILTTLTVIGIALAVSSHSFKGAAYWYETGFVSSDVVVPAKILQLAQKMRRMVPDSEIVVGILRQDDVVLDPYLLLRHHSQPDVILAIWDDNGIIAFAGE